MIVLRPICAGDQAAFIDLVHMAHLGITTLPKDRIRLQQKLELALASFGHHKHKAYYLFALEEEETLLGISAIAVGGERSCCWQRTVLTNDAPLEGLVHQIPILTSSWHRHDSELCSLLMHPDHRGRGLGHLLSLGRMLYIANHRNHFGNHLTAELRGTMLDNTSPFWEAVGRHFWNVSYEETQIRQQDGHAFMAAVMPLSPLYIDLLPQAIQALIGRPHDHAQGALSMLLREGFTLSQNVDWFDAGPHIQATINDVRAIRDSRVLRVRELRDSLNSSTECIISREQGEFRATTGALFTEGNDCIVTPSCAEALGISLGDQLRAIPIK